MTGDAVYSGTPTPSMKATAIGGNANSRGPWASVAALDRHYHGARQPRRPARSLRTPLPHIAYPAARKRLRLWNFNFAEVASELRNLSGRSRKPPIKQTSIFGIQVNVIL